MTAIWFCNSGMAVSFGSILPEDSKRIARHKAASHGDMAARPRQTRDFNPYCAKQPCVFGPADRSWHDHTTSRPGERRDPYAVPLRFGRIADAFRNKPRQGLWIPAFAGTTRAAP